MVSSVVVVIPAANEEALIGACLDAVAAARSDIQRQAGSRLEVSTVVVLDSCTDGTGAITRSRRHVSTVTSAAGCVGAARDLGVRNFLATSTSSLADIWICNTDADSQVPINWLTHMVAAADLGAHLILGTVLPADGLSPSARCRWLERHHQRDGHHHIHGANFGIRADVYQALGGWPKLASGEDVALARRALATSDLKVVRTGAIPVITSARLTGRAPRGFADYLQDLVNGTAVG
jgi:glycosyltransferase involved in cell wall biosynthesis